MQATIRGEVMRELGVIYNSNYYAISEHPELNFSKRLVVSADGRGINKLPLRRLEVSDSWAELARGERNRPEVGRICQGSIFKISKTSGTVYHWPIPSWGQ